MRMPLLLADFIHSRVCKPKCEKFLTRPTIQTADTTPAKAPEDTPALVKKIGKTTYRVRVHFSQTSTETMSDKIKRMLKNEIQQM